MAEKAIDLCQQSKVDYLILHVGTNNLIHDNFLNVQMQFRNCINYINWCFPETSIFISGLIFRQDKYWLNDRVKSVNDFLYSLQNNQTMFVDHNSTIRNLNRVLSNDGLHLRKSGVRLVAENLKNVLNFCYPFH